jgi:hypothetical protein
MKTVIFLKNITFKMARLEMAILDVKLATFLDISKWRHDTVHSDKTLHCGF